MDVGFCTVYTRLIFDFAYFIVTWETHEHFSMKNEIEESRSPMQRIINAEICVNDKLQM